MTVVAQPPQIHFSKLFVSFHFQLDGGSCPSFFPKKAPWKEKTTGKESAQATCMDTSAATELKKGTLPMLG